MTVFLLMICSALHNHLVLIRQGVLPGCYLVCRPHLSVIWNIGTNSHPSGGQGKSYLAPSHCLIQVTSQSVSCSSLQSTKSQVLRISGNISLLSAHCCSHYFTLKTPSSTQSNYIPMLKDILCQLICFLLTGPVYLKMLPPNGCIIHISTKNKSDNFLPLGKLDC